MRGRFSGGVKRTGRAAAALLAAAAQAGCFAHQYRTSPRVAVVSGDPVVQMKEPHRMPEAFSPPMVRLAAHSHPPRGKQKLLGLATVSPPRAYPIGLLDRVEVVNDEAGETPVVVARCALTHVAAVFDRRVSGRTLAFDNPAVLWRDTLVLRDRETGTYWSAATGVGLAGALAGAALEPLPAVYTTAAAWSRVHPDSLYLDLGTRTSVPFLMRVYGLSPWQGVSGEKTEDERLPGKREVFAVAAGGEAVAFTAEEIRRRRAIETTLAGGTLEIRWDDALQAPRAWRTASPRREVAVGPMYWFAVARHFERVALLGGGPDR
jgi:hypothetical protein